MRIQVVVTLDAAEALRWALEEDFREVVRGKAQNAAVGARALSSMTDPLALVLDDADNVLDNVPMPGYSPR